MASMHPIFFSVAINNHVYRGELLYLNRLLDASPEMGLISGPKDT